MARINIEDTFFLDERIAYVSKKIGKYEASGQFVYIIKLAQRYWLDGRQLIPEKIYALCDFSDEFIQADLVERRDGGLYLKGSEEHFEWYFKRLDASTTGGKESAKRARDKKGRLLPKQNPSEVQVESKCAPSDTA